MEKKTVMNVTPRLLDIYVAIVANLERPVNKETGKPYKGVLQSDVNDWFYDILKDEGHPLALVSNKECKYATPCGNCRKDLAGKVCEKALATGRIASRPYRGKDIIGADGEATKGKGGIVLGMPDEITSRSHDVSVKAKIMAAV